MQAVYEKYRDDKLVVVAVSLDRQDSAFVRQAVASQDVTFPNLHDQSADVGDAYGVRGVPRTFLVNHEGRVLGMATGSRQWDSPAFDDLFQHLLENLPPESVDP